MSDGGGGLKLPKLCEIIISKRPYSIFFLFVVICLCKNSNSVLACHQLAFETIIMLIFKNKNTNGGKWCVMIKGSN